MSNEQNEEKNPPQGSGEKVDLSQAIEVTPPEPGKMAFSHYIGLYSFSFSLLRA